MSDMEKVTDFALSLLRECDQKGSTVLSPLSIGLILALIHAGANGETKKQIGQALAKGASDGEVQELLTNLSNSFFKREDEKPDPMEKYFGEYKKEKAEVSLANRMYIRSDFVVEQSYLGVIKKNYDALALTTNFSSPAAVAKTINDFVSETTKEKITELIKPEMITEDTVAVLVNALYFKGKWLSPFTKGFTRKADFFATDGTTRKVDMMYQSGSRLYLETKEVQVLSLKYVEKAFALNIFLPKKNVGLASFLARTNGKELQKLLKDAQYETINVEIPRMKLETELRLPNTLKKMGITDVFELRSDLSGISHQKPLFVSEVVHKAAIEVDEEGTEAAAAVFATLMIGGFSEPKEPKVFRADRPFLYTLSKDNSPLFIGVYM